MSHSDLESLRYPIGRFTAPAVVSVAQRDAWIEQLATLPAALRAVVAPLSEPQLDTPYRPGGWTVRQVVHHLPDSHLNGIVRHKRAVTEDEPEASAYFEDRWVKLADHEAEPGPSLDLLEALHWRWVRFLRGLGEPAWQRRYLHSDDGPTALDVSLGAYAWHGRHHLAHVTQLAKREGW